MTRPTNAEPFVVRHYTEDRFPLIKGNGFDGLQVGKDREEAEEFVAWINERISRPANTEIAALLRDVELFVESAMLHFDRPDTLANLATIHSRIRAMAENLEGKA
jgi:hypothetical protein